MLQFDPNVLVVPLAALAGAGLFLAIGLPWVRARERHQRRVALALGDGAGSNRTNSAEGQVANRRKAIEKTLKEITDRQSARSPRHRKASLDQRLREAGLTWTLRFYWLLSAGIAAAAFLAASRFGPFVAVAIALLAGLLLPRFYIPFKRKRRLAAFAAGFPDVIDVIVRGVRAGRPLADCLAVIAIDTEDPIRSEFRLVVEDQSVGLPIHEAVDRLAQRVPLPEVGFLAIVVAIQNRAGGSLTEALGNLSTVLRGRKQLHAKVKSMSAEAKTSAGIIGSLPIAVAGLVQLTSPEYLAVLYQTNLGLVVLAASAMWMGIGIFIMRQMINFDM